MYLYYKIMTRNGAGAGMGMGAKVGMGAGKLRRKAG